MDPIYFVFSILFIFIQYLCINTYKFGLFTAVKNLGLSSLRLLFTEGNIFGARQLRKEFNSSLTALMLKLIPLCQKL